MVNHTDKQLVYDGIVFRVWQRQQQLFDGSTQTFECVERQASTMVLPVSGETVFLVRQQQPHRSERYWGHIGGRVAWGEDPLLGAQREFVEETALPAPSLTLLREYPGKGKILWPNFLFLTTDFDVEALSSVHTKDPGEEVMVKSMSLDEYFSCIGQRKCDVSGGRGEEIMQCMLNNTLDALKNELIMKSR